MVLLVLLEDCGDLSLVGGNIDLLKNFSASFSPKTLIVLLSVCISFEVKESSPSFGNSTRGTDVLFLSIG